MELSLNAEHIDHLITQEQKRYGQALGKVIGKGVSAPKPLADLLSIATRYEALQELRLKYLTPSPFQDDTPILVTESLDTEEDNGIPDGICDSEDCTDEFCVEYWERIESSGD